MLTKRVCLLHNIASFKWDVLNQPAYSPELAPSDYYLFTFLKLHMDGKRFSMDEEVKEEVDKWTKGKPLLGNRQKFDTLLQRLH